MSTYFIVAKGKLVFVGISVVSGSFLPLQAQLFAMARGQISMKNTILFISIFFLLSLESMAQKQLLGQNISAHNGSSWVQVAKQDYVYFLGGDSVEMTESNFNGSTYVPTRKEFIRTDGGTRVFSYIEQTLNQSTQMLENHQKVTNTYAYTTTNAGLIEFLFKVTSYNWNTGTQQWDTAYFEIAEVNDDGKIVTRTIYKNGASSLNTKFEQVWNSNGDLDTIYISDWNNGSWHQSTRLIYTYQNPGLKSSEEVHVWIDLQSRWLMYYKWDYTYAQNNKMSSQTKSNWSEVGSNWTPEFRSFTGYDADNDIDTVTSQYYQSGSWYNQYLFEYLYDTQHSSIAFPHYNAEVKVYPVPADDVLFFDSELRVRRITLMNLNGSVLMERETGSVLSGNLSTTELTSGFYILLMEMDNGMIESKKILVR